MRKLLLIGALLLLYVFVGAQETIDSSLILLKGKIVDSSNGEGIPFASVWIEGTYVGVASDLDGVFSLSVSSDDVSKNLIISVVGYSEYNTKISDYIATSPKSVDLRPKSILIEDVNISGKSLVNITLLKNAIKNISNNYHQNHLSFDAYYKCTSLFNENNEFVKEALLRVYDNKGYIKQSMPSVFKSINYEFLQSRKSKNNILLYDGFTMVDDLLSFDIVRNQQYILDENSFDNYDFNKVGEMYYEGENVIVISYKLKNNSLNNIGILDCYGRIYINKRNFSIQKNEMNLRSSNFSFLGRNIITHNPEIENAEYQVSSSYGKVSDYYCLRGIHLRVKVNYKDNNIKLYDSELIPINIKSENPDVVNRRQYYENVKYRKEFWERFSIIFQGEE